MNGRCKGETQEQGKCPVMDTRRTSQVRPEDGHSPCLISLQPRCAVAETAEDQILMFSKTSNSRQVTCSPAARRQVEPLYPSRDAAWSPIRPHPAARSHDPGATPIIPLFPCRSRLPLVSPATEAEPAAHLTSDQRRVISTPAVALKSLQLHVFFLQI